VSWLGRSWSHLPGVAACCLLLVLPSKAALAVYLFDHAFSASPSGTFVSSGITLSGAVDVDPLGSELMFAEPTELHRIALDGSSSSSSPFPFTGARVQVTSTRFSPGGELHLLSLNVDEGGDVRVATGASYPMVAQFADSRRFSNALVFDSAGNFFVSGTDGDPTSSGWLLGFDSAAGPLFDVNTDKTLVGLGADGANQLYGATSDAEVFRISGSGDVNFLGSLPQDLFGGPLGSVEAFAVDPAGNLFFGLGRGRKNGLNQSALVRMRADSLEADILALGTDDVPIDMVFAAGELHIASFQAGDAGDLTVLSSPPGRRFLTLSGDFDGPFAGNLNEGGFEVPEPAGGAIWLALLAAVAGVKQRRSVRRSEPR